MPNIAIPSSERESLALLIGRRLVDVIVPLSWTPSGKPVELQAEREPLVISSFDLWLDDGARFHIGADFIWDGEIEWLTVSLERSIRPSYLQKWSAGPEVGFASLLTLISLPVGEITSAQVLASDESLQLDAEPDIQFIVENGVELEFDSGERWQFCHGSDGGGYLRLTRVGPN